LHGKYGISQVSCPSLIVTLPLAKNLLHASQGAPIQRQGFRNSELLAFQQALSGQEDFQDEQLSGASTGLRGREVPVLFDHYRGHFMVSDFFEKSLIQVGSPSVLFYLKCKK
jgi:hypothetical protein